MLISEKDNRWRSLCNIQEKNEKMKNVVNAFGKVVVVSVEWSGFRYSWLYMHKYWIFKYYFSELGNFRSSDLLYLYILCHYRACYALRILSDWGSTDSTGIVKNNIIVINDSRSSEEKNAYSSHAEALWKKYYQSYTYVIGYANWYWSMIRFLSFVWYHWYNTII